MTVMSTIRKRFSPSAPVRPGEPGNGAPAAPTGGPARDDAPPIAGYDRLDVPEVKRMLPDHPQIELEAIEAYERAHQNRGAVLDKLHWMRGPEPLPGYDTLGADAISAALADADMATVKRVRGYERKFSKRPQVLEEAAVVLRRRHASRPAGSAPAYQPLSASSRSNGHPRPPVRARP